MTLIDAIEDNLKQHEEWDALVDTARIRRLIALNKRLVEGLAECVCQIEYLHTKFGETGTGNAVLARNSALLSEIKEK